VVPSAVRASDRFDFLFNLASVRNDTQYFLNLAVSDSGYGRPVIQPLLPRFRSLDADLPVALFLARESGRSLDAIVALRNERLDWGIVFGRVGVPLDRLFVGIDRDPGPPYGHAWGYWKNDPGHARLSDRDVCGLVHVQLGSRWSGVSTWDMARGVGRRSGVVTMVGEKKGRPWRDNPGRGHGKGRGHGRED
jgi:hypothetical protein